LKKYIPQSATSALFEIGDDNNYTPVSLDFNGTISSTTGSIKARAILGDHPQLSSSSFVANKTINRYWSLINENNIPGLTSYNATFNFVSGDLDQSFSISNSLISKYDNGWSFVNRGTVNALSIQSTGLTSFGDFQIGEGTDAPVVSQEPVNISGCAGGDVTFTSQSNTLPVPTIRWQRQKSNDTSWVNITTTNLDSGVVYAGFNSSYLALNGISTRINGYKYRAEFTNANGTVNSFAATLTVNVPPYIIYQPVSPTKICSGNGVQILSVSAGGGNLNYVWRNNGVSVVNDSVVSGQGTSTLIFTNTTSSYVGNYDVLIYSTCFPSITSNTVSIDLNPDLVPSVYAVSSDFDGKICSGETITFTANPTNGGSNPQYQWKVNAVAVPGATGSTFATNHLRDFDAVSVQMISSVVTCTSSPTVQSNVLFFRVNNSPSFVRNYASGCINKVVPIYLVSDTLPAVVNPWISLNTLIATVENGTPNASVTGRDTGVTYIVYTDINSCRDTLMYRVTSPLNSPDTIYGPQLVCNYYNNTGFTDTLYYQVDSVAGADSYDWIMPNGAQLVSGYGTTRIGVIVDSTILSRYGQGVIYMAALNESSCASPYISLRLYRTNPPVGSITGPSQICNYIDNDSLVHYHIDTVLGVRSYYWQVPTGAVIDSGQGTNDIYVLFNNTVRNYSTIQVTLSFNCAVIVKKSTQLYWSNPPSPTAIYGVDSVCNVGDGTIYTYYTDSVPGVSDYEWVLPNYVTLVSGLNTTTIKVRFESAYLSSSIKVRATTNCGSSYYKLFYVETKKYSKTGIISGPSNTCFYMNTGKPAIYSIKKVANVPYYLWEYPVVGTDSVVHPAGFGPNDTLIKVYYNSSLNLALEDSIQVRSGGCNNALPSLFTLKGAIPSIPVSIVGPFNACGYMVSSNNPNGTLVTYTISKVRDALSYIWAISGNATIIDHPAGYGENDTIIRVKYYSNFTSGTIYVNAANTCGFASPKTKLILIYKAGIVGLISDTTLSLCPKRIVEYSIPTLPIYADSIIWTVPSVGRILSGQGTTRIRVEYPPNINLSSLVSAKSLNNCSVGYTRYLRVSFSAVACPGATPAPTAKDLPYTNNEIKNEKTDNNFQVKIYPNPSADYFNVKVNAVKDEKITVMIFDMQGKELKRSSMSSGEINKIGAELRSGIYFIRIVQKGESKTEKIIKL
jgi:hypothetical protein